MRQHHPIWLSPNNNDIKNFTISYNSENEVSVRNFNIDDLNINRSNSLETEINRNMLGKDVLKFRNKDKKWYNNEEYFIEFKYKLKYPNCFVKRYGRDFPVKTQSANNIGRHQVYEDIERMEHIKKNYKCHSFVVFITNDNDYWETDTKKLRNSKTSPERSDYNFQLLDGDKTGCTNNDCGLVYLGGIKRKSEADTTEDKYSRRPIYVSNSYQIQWKPFRKISEKCGVFIVLVIDCDNPCKK